MTPGRTAVSLIVVLDLVPASAESDSVKSATATTLLGSIQIETAVSVGFHVIQYTITAHLCTCTSNLCACTADRRHPADRRRRARTEWELRDSRDAAKCKPDGAARTVQIRMGDAEQSDEGRGCLLYTSPSPRDRTRSRMPSSA